MQDADFMGEALREAEAAAQDSEVPVGAVIVLDGRVVARAHNRPVALNDPSAHAEILALRAAGEALGNYRLVDCDLFVTLEPCAMCLAAAIHARVRRLVYGAADPKGGAVVSNLNLLESPHWNHRLEVVAGVRREEASRLLQEFFAGRRDPKS